MIKRLNDRFPLRKVQLRHQKYTQSTHDARWTGPYLYIGLAIIDKILAYQKQREDLMYTCYALSETRTPLQASLFD